jgi:16S rRNA (cytosine967-C5)-methyltransferase
MNNYILFAYNILDDVYRHGAYASVAMGEVMPMLSEQDKKQVTRIVLGVLEHEMEFSYQINRLCLKSPKAVVRVLLKVGMYLLKYTRSMPDYAAVNETVELAKAVKKEMAGMVNATLKNYIAIKDDLPQTGLESLSIRANMPTWLINRYFDQYGIDEGTQLVLNKYNHTHIRWNNKTYSRYALRNFILDKGLPAVDTPHGYLVGATEPFGELIAEGKVTVQALDSIYICRALMEKGVTGQVLDLCAAPGGKSVYLAEYNDCQVTACDVHPHRVQLIEAYAKRMHVDNVTAICQDGTEYVADWEGRYDAVLVDAPCSGLGVVGENPDMLLNRTEQDLDNLPKLQLKLLSVAARYVKQYGALVYSTCTNLREENGNIVHEFLLRNPQFALEGMSELPENDGMKQFMPDEMGNDGFFVARMRRKV